MFVKMLTVSAGPNGVVPAGAIREVSDDEGRAIIDGRFGERAEKPRKIAIPETAAIESPENASMPHGVARTVRGRGG